MQVSFRLLFPLSLLSELKDEREGVEDRVVQCDKVVMPQSGSEPRVDPEPV